MSALKSFLAKQPPVVRAALTSGTIMMLGDVVAQKITKRPGQARGLDWRRTARFGVVGLTLHGPYFFKGMRTFDNLYGPSKAWLNVAKKTASSQAVLFPPFVALLFGWVGALEGKNVAQIKQKIKDNYPSAFKFGMIFWPAANMINFRYIEPHQRVLYVSVAGLIWNTFISWVNAHNQQSAATQKLTS